MRVASARQHRMVVEARAAGLARNYADALPVRGDQRNLAQPRGGEEAAGLGCRGQTAAIDQRDRAEEPPVALPQANAIAPRAGGGNVLAGTVHGNRADIGAEAA